jgi:hypothetical protein
VTDNGAFQAQTTASQLVLPAGTRRVRLTNMGPNIVYAATTAAKCTTALGTPIAITNGVLELDIAGHELYLIAATANQTTPADTRWRAG